MKQFLHTIRTGVVFGVMGTLLFSLGAPLLTVAQTDAGDIQDDISKVEKRLEQAKKEKNALEKNLSSINTSLSNTLAAINKTKGLLKQTTDTLQRKELEIQLTQQNIELKKEMLSDLIREMYLNSDKSMVQVMLGEQEFSEALDETEVFSHFGEKVQLALNDLQDLRNQTEAQKAELENIKEDHEDLLAQKAAQKQELAADQAETQADIKEQEATIAELQKKLQKLRSDLSSLLGTNVSTDDVMEAAGIASKATGVRKAFILGELTQESGLGRFTGGCLYKNTRVKPADKTAFKQIMDELGYDVNKKKISCSPGYGYGGAMGIAQFMPTTWLGYKAKISAMTGHKPPDPWNVVDGVVGMAIKLANGGATSKSGEKLAAKRYYCGGPSSAYWNNKCEAYAKNVLRLADGYEKNN